MIDSNTAMHKPWYSGNNRIPYGWTLAADGKSIRRIFEYPDFLQAFAFMRRGGHCRGTVESSPGMEQCLQSR